MSDNVNAPLPAGFLDALRAQFRDDFFSESPDDLLEYGRDWTRVYTPAASLVAFPKTTAEVSTYLALCNRYSVAVVPSGGRTGLSAGAVAAHGETVISLSKMRALGEVDTVGRTLRVEAGAITEEVHKHAEAFGLTWPVDFASKGSSQVGGNIATNAGGVKVIRYGLTRNWVLGLEVVLADGRVLCMDHALEKNNTGTDLRQLFIGSEGTLGIITAATLKLTRVPQSARVFLFAVSSLAEVVTLFRAVCNGPFVLSAYEFFTQACLDRLLSHRPLRSPFASPHSHYVLVEVEGDGDLDEWLAGLFERELVSDGVMAAHGTQAAELWALREGISESLSATGFPYKNDISVPVAALEAFCAELNHVFASEYPGFEICLFGHVGDGNLHVNVMKPADMTRDDFLVHAKASDKTMFALVQKHNGSVSAEHGIGLLKRAALHYTRSESELAVMRTLKTALDPKGILNPGKIL